MSEEKIVFILDTNIPLQKHFSFLSFKEHDFPTLLTLIHNLTVFLLQFIVLISDKQIK